MIRKTVGTCRILAAIAFDKHDVPIWPIMKNVRYCEGHELRTELLPPVTSFETMVSILPDKA
jgi:hypothetical protein